ncbi:hypothetical protein B0O99DRAFT_747707 [Bisporella sp. PMI_857]|nr:hypothetical protein B0O99DRAFT_747707 [Bisporella sp. PMI_857]
MKKILRSMTARRETRHSAASALSTSAVVPNSGLVFVDNSQGGSAAVGELSHVLDAALDGIDGDFDGDFDTDNIQKKLQLLDNQAAKHANSKVNADADKWKCTQSEATIVELAWKSSAAVYEPVTSLADSSFIFEELVSLSPSLGGSVKKSTLAIVSQNPSSNAAENPYLPMLVVAVRGTKSKVDMMVNSNSKGKSFMELSEEHAGGSKLTSVDGVEAHAGFLMGAESLMPQINKILEKLVRDGNVKHVLFTGHSAGGSVASLLWLKLLCLGAKNSTESDNSDPTLYFSTITFGAAATIRPADTISKIPKDANRGMQLLFVNEFDIVSRADTKYLISLVDLYRSIYELPPIQKVGEEISNKDNTPSIASAAVADVCLETGAGLIDGELMGNRNWRLPEPEYWHLQTIVVLKLSLKDIDTGIDENSGEGNTTGVQSSVALTAVNITPEEFAKLLFCRVSVHRRIHYRERVEMISQGSFNGLSGWKSDQEPKPGIAGP